MTTRGEDGYRLLLEQLVGTGTVVTTDGRTCYDVVDKDYGAKFHGLNSMPAILKCQVETEPRPTPVAFGCGLTYFFDHDISILYLLYLFN